MPIMIKSFKHKGLEDFFFNDTKKGIIPGHASKLARILDRLVCMCKRELESNFLF